VTDQQMQSATSTAGVPPIAERRSFLRTHHGDTFDDPYEWLRDKDDPAVIAYLEAENAYTEEQTKHLEELRQEIFDDIRLRTKETDLSVPSYTSHRSADGAASAFWYYQRTQEGAEYPIFCRAPAGDPETPPDVEGDIAGEQVLLDSNAEAGDSEFFSLGAFSVSPDGRLLAYAVDLTGNERFQLRLKNLSTGDRLPDVIEDIAYGVAWAGDDHLFYTRADEAWRPFQVLRHRLGTDPADDPVIFAEPRRALLGQRRQQPRPGVDPDPCRQQADHGDPAAAHRRAHRRAQARGAAPARCRIRGGDRRRPVVDLAQ
jgi:oligopeptidase B